MGNRDRQGCCEHVLAPHRHNRFGLIDRGLLRATGRTITRSPEAKPELVRRRIEKEVLSYFKQPAEIDAILTDPSLLRVVSEDYEEQLRRYQAAFKREQMLVLVYDDFRRDNVGTIRSVLRFLEADDTHPVDRLEANPTVGVRSRRLHHLVHAVQVGHGPVSLNAKAAIKALTPRRLRRDVLRAAKQRVLYRTPPPPEEAFMLELRRRFTGEIVALSEYLDRDLVTLWSYDDLG